MKAFKPAVCPHDCPSVCALDVEVLDNDRIGRVRGGHRSGFTAGVICAKVARYAERIHNPARLTRPLLRTGKKGRGDFTPIGWDEALDRIADAELAPISTGHLSPTKEGLGTGLSICSCPILKSSPMVAVAGAGQRPRSFGLSRKRGRGMTASRLLPGRVAWRPICWTPTQTDVGGRKHHRERR